MMILCLFLSTVLTAVHCDDYGGGPGTILLGTSAGGDGGYGGADGPGYGGGDAGKSGYGGVDSIGPEYNIGSPAGGAYGGSIPAGPTYGRDDTAGSSYGGSGSSDGALGKSSFGGINAPTASYGGNVNVPLYGGGSSGGSSAYGSGASNDGASSSGTYGRQKIVPPAYGGTPPAKPVYSGARGDSASGSKKVVTGVYRNGAARISGAGHGYFPDAKKFSAQSSSAPVYSRVADVAPLASGTGCPHGYMSYGGSCYLFSREKLTWFHAAMKCEYMGGYLAVANSAHENSYFKLMSAKLGMKEGVWIGLNDILFPQSHLWYWGFSSKQCKWFDWGPKEPVFEGMGIRNCVLMWDSYQFCWKVENCNAHHYYICEYNPKKVCSCNTY